jgi:hypothetical protein
MRNLVVVAAVIAAGMSFAETGAPLPSGTYTGTADWRGPGGSSGQYTVEKTFDGNSLTAHYTWTDAQRREERHTVTFASKATDPVFDVVDAKGENVGRGYCYDDACSYRATFGPVTVDETFRWSGDAMTVLGSKSGPGFTVVWKETLTLR